MNNLPLTINKTGVFAFCFVQGGKWTALPQPVTINGPSTMEALVPPANGTGAFTVFNSSAGEYPRISQAFGAQVQGFGLTDRDKMSFSQRDCPALETYTSSGVELLSPNEWVASSTWRLTNVTVNLPGVYNLCYWWFGHPVPHWVSLGSVTVLFPLVDSPSPSPSPEPQSGLDGLLAGAAEFITANPAASVPILAAIGIAICICCVLCVYWYRRRRHKRELADIVWVDPMEAAAGNMAVNPLAMYDANVANLPEALRERPRSAMETRPLFAYDPVLKPDDIDLEETLEPKTLEPPPGVQQDVDDGFDPFWDPVKKPDKPEADPYDFLFDDDDPKQTPLFPEVKKPKKYRKSSGSPVKGKGETDKDSQDGSKEGDLSPDLSRRKRGEDRWETRSMYSTNTRVSRWFTMHSARASMAASTASSPQVSLSPHTHPTSNATLASQCS